MKKTRLKSSGIIGGALSLTLSSLIVKFLGLIYKVPLSYILSDEGMGYFNSAYTVYTFFYIICTAGVPKAISILTSEAESDGDSLRVKSIYTTALSMFLGLGSIITAVFLFTAGPISKIIGNNGAYLTMMVIAPSIMFVCASGVIRGYFNGKMSFLPIAVSEVISGVSKLALGLVFAILGARLGLSLEVISALTILGITLGAFFGFIYLLICKKHEKTDVTSGQNVTKARFSRKISKQILKIAMPLTLASAIGSISSIIDLSIIMKRLAYAGYTELQAGVLYGNYTTLAIPMLNLVATLIAPLSAVLLPVVSRVDIKRDTRALSERICVALKILGFIAVPAALLFTFKSEELLMLIFEDSSAIISAPLLQLLAPGIIFMCFLTVINTALEGTGKTKIPMISLLIGSVVKLIISYILIGNAEYAILGAPIGTTLSYFVSFIISASYFVAKQKIHINVLSSIIPVAIASIISLGISELLITAINVSGSLAIISQLAIFAIIYIGLVVTFNISGFKSLQKMAKYTKK